MVRRCIPHSKLRECLKNAKGDYIFLSDQDDQWMPNKVEVMMKALQQSSCVVSDCVVTDGALNVTAPSFYELNRTRAGWMYNLFVKNGYLGCCMAFRGVYLKSLCLFQNILLCTTSGLAILPLCIMMCAL